MPYKNLQSHIQPPTYLGLAIYCACTDLGPDIMCTWLGESKKKPQHIVLHPSPTMMLL